MNKPAVIHPVILAVPEHARRLKGREKVTALRRYARAALHQSALHSGVTLGPLEKAENGAPLPYGGVYWSLSHIQSYVAAVTASRPIGIDIEKDRPFTEGLYQRLAEPWEWELAPAVNQALFYRYWTAKEAVLKAVGIGIPGLTRCHIVKILDDNHLELRFDQSIWRVTQNRTIENHIVAIASEDVDIEWHQRN